MRRPTNRRKRDKGAERCLRTTRLSWSKSLVPLLLLSTLLCLLAPSRSYAATQDEVFKSIEQSVGEKTQFDSRPVILLLCGGGLVLLLLSLMSRRQKKAVTPRALNHPGKLIKEVLRDVPLKSGEVRQLKTLASSLEPETGTAPDPLALLLCPSLLVKGLKNSGERVDRKTVAQVVRKLQLNSESKPGKSP